MSTVNVIQWLAWTQFAVGKLNTGSTSPHFHVNDIIRVCRDKRYSGMSIANKRSTVNTTFQPNMSTITKIEVSEKEYKRLEKQVTLLLKSLKPDIGDDYRACEDDNCPGMQVTIGATPQADGYLQWNFQTGDNSYTGGAYGHANWGVIYLYRRSNCAELAHNAVQEIADAISNNMASVSDPR